jgi:hypothetical protein
MHDICKRLLIKKLLEGDVHNTLEEITLENLSIQVLAVYPNLKKITVEATDNFPKESDLKNWTKAKWKDVHVSCRS